jgi:hypothetical protein
MIRVFKTVVTKWNKFQTLRVEDKVLFLRASVLLLSVRLLLNCLPLHRAIQLLDFMQHKGDIDYQNHLKFVHRVVRSVDVAGNCLLDSPCLPKALAAQILLRRKRIETKLCIGFIIRDKKYTGHAWLKLGEEVILGDVPHLDLYVPLPVHRVRKAAIVATPLSTTFETPLSTVIASEAKQSAQDTIASEAKQSAQDTNSGEQRRGVNHVQISSLPSSGQAVVFAALKLQPMTIARQID